MKFISMLLVTIVTTAALADIPLPPRPQIEPGPIQKIGEQGVESINAMASAKATDLKKFLAAGNRITAATFQALQLGQTIYTFTRQICTSGGIAGPNCLGGAQLQVSITEKQSGQLTKVTVTSSVVMLR